MPLEIFVSTDWKTLITDRTLSIDTRLDALFEATRTYEPEHFPLLAALITDDEESVELRSAIAVCFGKFGELALSESARAPFYNVLAGLRNHPDAKLRNYVMLGFGMMLEPEAIPFLIDALNDEDNAVFYTAADALVKLGRDAMPAVLELLTDSTEDDIRCVAAWKLGEMGYPESIDILLAVIDVNDTTTELRALCIWALGEIGFRTKAVVTALELAMDHPNSDIYERAQLALKKIARHSN